jgi:branched-chain amino acid transport system ATP-binding protein
MKKYKRHISARRLNLLEVLGLTIFFENAIALNDFSMSIDEGQLVAVVGSNSAGKTTLMNAVAGLLDDMRIKEKRRGGIRISIFGKILFKGEEISGLRAHERVRKGIVLCRERHPVFPDCDVMENLRIAEYLGVSREKGDMIREVFQLFPLVYALRKRKAGFLSGGEQQMLSIGMALVTRPGLLLLDEPFLGLSPLIQYELIKAIIDIKNKKGITILICEQFARPLLPVIDMGYVIENGMLMLSGTGQELMANPEVKAAYFGV